MAEIHNFSDLKTIQLLECELLEVRNELRQANGYDPVMSLAENAKMMIDCARLLGSLHKNLRIRFDALKKEQENAKNVARSYPVTGGVRTFTVADEEACGSAPLLPETYCR